MSKLIVICGATGEGKTTFAKGLCKNRKHIAVDYGNDFAGFTRFTDVHKMDLFLSYFEPKKEKIKDSIVVIDEATICFNNHRYNDDLNMILVRKRHVNNTYVLLFHSIRQVPLYIKDFIDLLVLFKTNDIYKEVAKYPKGDLIWAKMQELSDLESNYGKTPDKHYFPKIINLK